MMRSQSAVVAVEGGKRALIFEARVESPKSVPQRCTSSVGSSAVRGRGAGGKAVRVGLINSRQVQELPGRLKQVDIPPTSI